MVPAGVKALTDEGHTVLLEEGAGEGSGIANDEYTQAGGTLTSCEQVWARSEMIVKGQGTGCARVSATPREDRFYFTYLHLAPLPDLTRVLLEKKIVGIAYETIKEDDGSLPLLTPMSEVAGRMAIQIGAQYLEKSQGGRGILLSGVPGVPPAQVVILGGGIVGLNSAKSALGMGAHVTVLDNNVHKLRYLDDVFLGRVATLASNAITIAHSIRKADLLVGAVLVPGASAPKVGNSPNDLYHEERGGDCRCRSGSRVAVLKQLIRQRTAIPHFMWMVSCTIVLRTCLVLFPEPQLLL
jgi:alanine dehydrogenase